MAIKKEEAGKFTEQQLAEVRSLEQKIDEIITEEYFPGDFSENIIVELDWLPDLRVVKEVIRLFEEAGWEISLEHGQREGGYWFSLT
ncbi:MAG: hypothetical protein COV69_01600 [Parcubacteria group bacterium CG11_big_fil_rev_8_21_14_0_20_39_14]|nr:MAG: hypothetical protein COV69_01600 [Parcubacteria group bacterium CG11_big_fil_rev_8_21_14_0_20_39_14]PIS35288.1 MAG: hypothetical protein COT36_03140 [Parcubacteria group bacterium CG08_land_8_20_14_0_20_38_56]